MNTTYVSASELKRNAAEILNSVYYKKNTTIVERFGKAIAKIVPVEERIEGKKSVAKILNNYFGVLPNFPKTKNIRYFRKRNTSL